MHAHGTVPHDPSMPQDVEYKITEDWKKKIEMNRRRGEEHAVESYSYEELQMDLADVIDEDEKEQQRNTSSARWRVHQLGPNAKDLKKWPTSRR